MATPDYQYLSGLVRQFQQGSQAAFAEFYAATSSQQYRYALNYLKDVHLAQDAVQEVYLTAFRNADKLRDPTLCLAWLNQINFRVCYRMYQRNSRSDVLDDEKLALREATGEGSHPEQELVQVDSREFLLKQILALPEREAQVIFLHYYRRIKLQDVAESMDVSLSTVKRYQVSGIAKLKRSLIANGMM